MPFNIQTGLSTCSEDIENSRGELKKCILLFGPVIQEAETSASIFSLTTLDKGNLETPPDRWLL